MEDMNTSFSFDMLDMIDNNDYLKLEIKSNGKNGEDEKLLEMNRNKNKKEISDSNNCIFGESKKSRRKKNKTNGNIFPEVSEMKNEDIYEFKKHHNFLLKNKVNENENKLKKTEKKKIVRNILNRKILKNCNSNILPIEDNLNNETQNQNLSSENTLDSILYINKASNYETPSNKIDLNTYVDLENCNTNNTNNINNNTTTNINYINNTTTTINSINASLNEINKIDRDIFINSFECQNCKNYLKEITSKNYMNFSILGEYINDGENDMLLLKNKKIEELENKNKLMLQKIKVLKRKNSFLSNKIKKFSTSLGDLNLNFNKLIKENNILKEINKNLNDTLEKEKSLNLKMQKKITSKESTYCKKPSEKEFEDSIDMEIFNE